MCTSNSLAPAIPLPCWSVEETVCDLWWNYRIGSTGPCWESHASRTFLRDITLPPGTVGSITCRSKRQTCSRRALQLRALRKSFEHARQCTRTHAKGTTLLCYTYATFKCCAYIEGLPCQGCQYLACSHPLSHIQEPPCRAYGAALCGSCSSCILPASAGHLTYCIHQGRHTEDAQHGTCIIQGGSQHLFRHVQERS